MKLGNKIVKILAVDPESYSLKLKFSGHATVALSLNDIFQHPTGLAAEILAGNFFNKCFIEAGALAWPNGLELCPDALWAMAVKQGVKKKKAA